ncbi:uncharacterized protein DS421_12g368370 [Arachis hypogaea]|nr:uncharacterized protein DS421_12g368370 [Arachis hypogaea]
MAFSGPYLLYAWHFYHAENLRFSFYIVLLFFRCRSRGSSLGVWILESEVVLGCILVSICIYVYICVAYSPSNLCTLLLLEDEGEIGVYFGILVYFGDTYVCLYVYMYPSASLSFAG